MNILQAVFFYEPAVQYGGPTVNVKAIGKRLKEKQHDVSIYCTNYSDYRHRMSRKTFHQVRDGIKVTYLNSFRVFPTQNGRHGLVITPDLLHKLDQDFKSFNIIHVNAYRTFLAVSLALKARQYRIPYIIQARGSLECLAGNIPLKRLFDFICGKRILQSADAVIALTEYEKSLYHSMGVKNDKIRVISNGLDLRAIQSKIRPGAFRQKLNIPSGKKMVLFLGRIHLTKGVDVLIKAFSRVSASDSCLVIVGPDEGHLDLAHKTAAAMGLKEDQIYFPGPIYGDEKFNAYHDADIFVRASFLEGLPMSVIEALACGTPVVISHQCGLTKTIDGQAGIVVDYDEESVFTALDNLLANDSLRNEFSVNAASIARRFDLSVVIDHLLFLYTSLIAQRAA